MKVLKYVLLAVGGVVALVLLAIAVVVAAFDPNKYKPELAAAVKDKTGRTLAIEGNLGLTVFPSIGIAVGKTSLSEPNSSRIFARIDEAKMSLALLPLFSRQVVVNRVALSGLTADLVKHKDGTTNFEDLLNPPGHAEAPPVRSKPAPAPKPAAQAGAVRVDIAGIEIRSSAVGWRDDSSGNRLKASLAELKTGRIASGVPGKLSLAARIEGTKPRIDLQIKLSSGYRFDFEKQKFALSGIDLRLSEESAGASPATTTLKGDAEIVAPQSIRFDLALDHLDVDRYLGTGKGKASAGSGAARGAPAAARGAPAVAAEEPIDLSPLKGLNLKGTLKIGALVASNVKLEKINVGTQASGGQVQINPLAASLYQGNLTGNASVNANTNRLALKAQLGGVAIGPLLRDALNNDLLEGRGNVALDVQTGGTTVSAMKKALSGSASLTLRDGALKGVNLDNAIRKVRSLGSKPPEQKADRTERTDFAELGASFVIKNGVAHNEDLSAKSPLLRLAGSGDVNIGANSIDYLAKASVVASSGGQGGKDVAQLRGVTVPVKITGPLDAPRFRVDLGATVGEAVKQKAEDKLKERVQDRLKGLFGR
ncbi:MAG TPA: AsmA family protein [Burkholderiales bacterium]|nr:AsmA family protein [Burkholderiales bacterium]